MNARILRKWSIHTKNLMSCSASSLVVVVLLLLLLLVTCAPTLVLATMNQSPPRTTTSSLLLSSSSSPPSDAPAPAPRVVENPLYMPKNVQVVVVGAEATQTRQTRPSSTAIATATAIASATSSSSQQQQQQPPATSWLPYRSHSRLASPRVEVATNGDIMTRESFPGFYNTNRRNRPDDIRPAPAIWPLPLRHQQLVAPHHHLVPMTSSSDGMAKPSRLNSGYVAQNKDILNTPSSSSSSGSRRMGWPQRLITSSSPMESYNDDNEDAGNNEDDDINLDEVDDEEDDVDLDDIEEDEDEDDTQLNDNIKPNNNPTTVAAANSPDNAELLEFEADIIKPRLSVRNVADTAAATSSSSSSYATQQHSSSPGQLYNLRRLDDRRHQVAPLTMPTQHHTPSFPKLTPQEEIPPPPSLKKNRMMTTTTSTKTTLYSYKQTEQSGSPIFSPAEHKSKTFETDKVFDISNILNVNKIKSSAAASPIRFVIESYEVASQPLSSEHRRTTASGTALQRKNLLPRLRQLRSRHQQQQQTARSRRDSLRSSYNKRNQHQVDDSGASSYSSSSSSSSSPTITHNQSFRKLNANAQSHHHNNNNNNQHHHHHNNNNLRQQRMRNKHARRYCSARDPAQLAFEAPTVFEGKIVSMTPDRRMNFSATVEVREVFKQQIGYRLQKYLRLQFAYRNSSGECDIYREQLRPRGLVKGDTIEPGRMYLLFVQQIDIGNFTILGQPIRKTKRVVEAVRNAVSENYAQLASIRSISASNRTVENGQELRIVCKVTGRPPPKVTWFKDHRSINRNRKLYQFTHYKKRSELIIRSFNTSDAGRYECRAKNKVNRNIERRAIVIKAYPVQRFDPNPRGAGNTCPDDASEFCFNGGTCKFFSEISSYSCICPEGFIGERCDRKEVNNPSTYSNEQECGDKKYFGSYYC